MNKTLERVRELFPEADEIADSNLRAKVLKTWLAAWQLSPFDQLEQTPFLEGALAEINNVEHTRAVTVMSIQFAKIAREFLNIQVNTDYLIAGAILHDMGKVFEYCEVKTDLGRLFTHSVSAGLIAAKEDLPPEVIHIIVMHSLEGDLVKRSPEAAIVHYMDFAYAEFALRSKTPINLDELIKLKKLKRAFNFIKI